MQHRALSSIGRRAVVATLLVLACAVGVSACGSSNTSSNASASTSSSARSQARLNLAKCFRQHGINVPDPSTGGGPAGGGGVFRALQGYSQAQVQAATKACRQYFAQAFPRLNLSPAQQAQFRQEFIKFAECMRSHGVTSPIRPRVARAGSGSAARSDRSTATAPRSRRQRRRARA